MTDGSTPTGDSAWLPIRGYRFVCAYDYLDENGELVEQRGRFDLIDPETEDLKPKTFRPRWPSGTPRRPFVYTCPPGARRVIYELPDVIRAAESAADIWWFEGEKDVEAARELGLVATTNGPAGAPLPKDFGEQVRGAGRLFVVPDNDEPGRAHACRVAEAAAPFVSDVRIVELPVPEHGDLSDFLDQGHSAENLLRMGETAETWRPAPEPPEETDRAATSKAGELVDLADDLVLFHTAEDEAWAILPSNSHVENHRVGSRRFASWLRQRHYTKTGRPVPAQALADAVATIEAKALYDAPERLVYLRVGADAEAIVIDLGDQSWGAVRVDPTGWQVCAESPIAFRRTSTLRALPLPTRGGDIGELLGYLNVEDEAIPLVLGFLVAALRPTGPYPVLVICGEQGSAKTTLSRVLRSLIDPCTPTDRSAQRDERDLAIAAKNARLLCYDNLSHLQPWFSDALCRLSTGGGFATRSLYTNDEEFIFDACRPVILNGIEELAHRPDLLDRSVIVRCPVIPEERRRDHSDFWAEFKAASSRMFGCLLDALSTGLRRLPDVELVGAPRLADFARFAVACEPALGLDQGAFLKAYRGNRAEAHELALDSAAIAEPLRRLVKRLPYGDTWEGTCAELLAELTEQAGESVIKRKDWPASPRGLSGQLTRLRPNLRAVGVLVEDRGRRAGHGGALFSVRESHPEVPARPSQPSHSLQASGKQGELL